jgi:thiol-disulfide isomerase/thioredoxin
MSKRTIRGLLIALLVPSAILVNALDGPGSTQLPTYNVGSTISADIKLTDVYGKEHSFKDYRGKIVFIHFWSTHCPVVKNYEPKFVRFQKELVGKDVVQIAVNSNQPELKGDFANLREYAENAGFNFPVMVDPDQRFADLLGAQVTPHCFVIDKRGVLRYSGNFDDDPEGSKGDEAKPFVRDAISAILGGQLIRVTRTRPYGCAIKAPD